MKSTTCNVQDDVQKTELLDGLDMLPPVPASIKDEMPNMAAMLQSISGYMGREFVAAMVKASMDLRRAYDSNDFRAASQVYARKDGWIACGESGFQLGVPDAYMKAFANRHRKGFNYGAH